MVADPKQPSNGREGDASCEARYGVLDRRLVASETDPKIFTLPFSKIATNARGNGRAAVFSFGAVPTEPQERKKTRFVTKKSTIRDVCKFAIFHVFNIFYSTVVSTTPSIEPTAEVFVIHI